MTDRPPNWDDLTRTARESQGLHPAARAPEFDELCAAVFTTALGKDLMKALRQRTIERRIAANLTEATLRELTAENRFVHDLARAVERGLEARAITAKEAKPGT